MWNRPSKNSIRKVREQLEASLDDTIAIGVPKPGSQQEEEEKVKKIPGRS